MLCNFLSAIGPLFFKKNELTGKKNGIKWVKEFFVVVPQPLNELTSNLTLVAASGSNDDAVRIRAMLNHSTVSEFVDVNVICTVPNITLIESKITLFIV